MLYHRGVARFLSYAAAVVVSLAGVLGSGAGCEGTCEFAIIPKNETCSASCATLNRQDILEGVICAQPDCSLDAPCEAGFTCVAVGKPVCLPACETVDETCEGGLVCSELDDAVTGDVTTACFFDG